jgi:SulP family sulfate permease
MPRFFANASRLRDEILEGVNGSRPPIRCVTLNMDDIDSTGAQVLLELIEAPDDESLALVHSCVRPEVRDELESRGVGSHVGAADICLDANRAVAVQQQQPARDTGWAIDVNGR